MSMSYIIFPNDPKDSFDITLGKHIALIQKLINMTLNYKGVEVRKISFIDYENKQIYPSFPCEKQLCIENTSTLDKFGFGSFAGRFFDVIVKLHSDNHMNIRIFYSIENDKPI